MQTLLQTEHLWPAEDVLKLRLRSMACAGRYGTPGVLYPVQGSNTCAGGLSESPRPARQTAGQQELSVHALSGAGAVGKHSRSLLRAQRSLWQLTWQELK